MRRIQGIPVDELTGAAVVTDFDSAMVSEGRGFLCRNSTSSLAEDAIYVVAFKTPDDVLVHLEIEYQIVRKGSLVLYEGCSWTQGTGFQANIRNRRRDSERTSKMLENKTGEVFAATGHLMRSPTGLSGGDSIFIGETKADDESGVVGSKNLILKPGETYAFYFECTSANGGAIGLDMSWVERAHDTIAAAPPSPV